jgi:hypothetical protein
MDTLGVCDAMIGEQVFLLVLGAAVGAGLSLIPGLVLDEVRRSRDRRDRHDRAERVVRALTMEVEEGVHRCEALSALLGRVEVSYSSVYTSLWDTTQAELAQWLEDVESLVLLHRIYYRFHLVNFNMNRGEFGVGARFAQEYIEEMKDNLSKVRERRPQIRAQDQGVATRGDGAMRGRRP